MIWLFWMVYRPRIILQKVEGFFSLPLDGGELGWGGIDRHCFNQSPSPNPLPPGEGELLMPTFCKVSVEHDARPGIAVSSGMDYHQPPSALFNVDGGGKGKKNNYLIEVISHPY